MLLPCNGVNGDGDGDGEKILPKGWTGQAVTLFMMLQPIII